jgi:hypothetical protein
MYLGIPEAVIMIQQTAGDLNNFGVFRGYRATNSITNKTRATQSGTWRCISTAQHFSGQTGGNNGVTYRLSIAGLFQRIS